MNAVFSTHCNAGSARNLAQQPSVRAGDTFVYHLRRACSLSSGRTSSLCPSCAAICAGSLRRCCLPGFWGQDRTKSRGWGHDTASNPARTYNDWVGLSDFNRCTFPNHHRAHKSSRPRGTFQGTSMVWKSAAIEIYGGGHLRKRATKIPSYFVRRLG